MEKLLRFEHEFELVKNISTFDAVLVTIFLLNIRRDIEIDGSRLTHSICKSQVIISSFEKLERANRLSYKRSRMMRHLSQGYSISV